MKRPALLASIASAALVVASSVGLMIAGSTAQASPASTTTNMYVTFYGWYDNSPPGAGIAFPGLHSSAGGTGTFSDPITFATDRSELKPGTKVYYATVKKYFVMEDDCTECDEDWTGHGPDGGPKFWHVDLWTGGKGGNEKAAIDCEDALTQANPDGSPKQTPVLVNPPSTEPVDSTPLFNAKTGACYGGATSPTTFGQYKNGSSGLCMTDPSGSTKSGTLLDVSACNGGATQKFGFDGAFLTIDNLCVGAAGASTSNGTKMNISTCTGAPPQQWEINANHTIAGIQSNKCIQVSGTSLALASCTASGNQQWTFTKEG